MAASTTSRLAGPAQKQSSKSSPPWAANATGSSPSAEATSATPGASGIAASSSSIATPLARAR